MKKISIILPAYNVNQYIAETCATVQMQSYLNWECIIVDDGSTDDTYTTIKKIAAREPRFKIVHQTNAGVSAARNNGIGHASGDYVTFLDGDDLWDAHALEQFIKVLDSHPDCMLVWGKASRFDSDTGIDKPVVWKNYLAGGDPWHNMLIFDFIPVGSFCVRHSLLSSGYRFSDRFTHAEDRDFLLRVLKDHRAMSLEATVLRIRLHRSSASFNARAALAGELHVMEEHLADPTIPSYIRRRAQSALAFRCAVIAAFTEKNYIRALIWYLLALGKDPLNINNYLLPLRKLFSCFGTVF